MRTILILLEACALILTASVAVAADQDRKSREREDKPDRVELALLMRSLHRDTNSVHRFLRLCDTSPEIVGDLKAYWKASQSRRKQAIAKKKLTVSRAAHVGGKDLSCFGYTFTAPWEEPMKRQERPTGVYFTFPEGQTLIVADPSVDDFIDKLLALEAPSHLLKRALPKYADKPGYEFFRSVQRASVTDLDGLTASEDIVRINALLFFRESIPDFRAASVSEFQTDDMRGYLFAGAGPSTSHQVYIFDEQDERIVLTMFCKSQSESTTKADVRRLLATFHKTDVKPEGGSEQTPERDK